MDWQEKWGVCYNKNRIRKNILWNKKCMVNGVKNVLQRRLLGYFLLISLVPTFLFLGCYLYSTQRQMQRQMQNERRILLEHAAEKIGSRITQVNEFVSWTVRDETIRSLMYRSSEQAAIYDETSHAAAQILREQFSYRPITRYMLAFILMGDNGIDLRAGTEGYLIDEAQIRFAMEHEQKSPQWDGITRNLTTLTENTMVIPYYRHITNESTGQSLGDLLILFSPDLFADELTEILLLDDEHLGLYNEKGEVLSVDIPSTGWKLQQKPETALGQQIWTLISAGCLFVAVVAGFLVALSVFLSKNISLPIERLTAHIRRLSSGDFTHTVTTVRGSSEIDEVDRRLQDMGDDIQRLLHQQEEKQRLELYMLQSQINPHFLYNTLNSIRLMATLQGKNSIAEMIEALGRLLRANLAGSEEMIPLREEIGLLESYLYIQDTRLKGKLCIEMQVPQELMECSVLKFVLQPLAENAILHGIGSRPTGGTLRIMAEKQEDVLLLSVADDGCGIAEEKAVELRKKLSIADAEAIPNGSHGMALRNVQTRIQLRWGKQYGLSFDTKLGMGTVMRLALPLLRREQEEED